MIRDFDPFGPTGVSAKMSAVLMLGYALAGDRECASRLAERYLAEDNAALAEAREPRHDDYVNAWREEARRTLIAEGIKQPGKRERLRALGLVRKGKRGNAPKPLAQLRNHALIERAKRERPNDRRLDIQLDVLNEPKTAERQQTAARKLLATEECLRNVRTVSDLADAPSEPIEYDLAAFRRGARALSRLDERSKETDALLVNARSHGLIDF